MDSNNIYELLKRSLLGNLSREEQLRLDEWLGEKESRKRMYRQLMDADDMVETYSMCQGTDTFRAWKDFEIRTGRSHTVVKHLLKPLSIAIAVAAVLLIVLQIVPHKPESIAPNLSPEVVASINRAEQSKSTEATVSIQGESPVRLTSASGLDQLMSDADIADGADATIVTRLDKEFWLTLPDGTRVHLNYGTTITYPTVFGDDTREVKLNGEAYFIVAHDENRPFIVHTHDAAVKEYGTEFNVYTRTGHTDVVLVRGSIGVTAKAGKERMMQPGERAEVMGARVTMSKVDVEPYIAWNTGQFIFDDCTLETLMQVIGRWYGCDVEFADNALRSVRLAGSLSRYETETTTLEAIRQIAGVQTERTGRKIVIKP